MSITVICPSAESLSHCLYTVFAVQPSVITLLALCLLRLLPP